MLQFKPMSSYDYLQRMSTSSVQCGAGTNFWVERYFPAVTRRGRSSAREHRPDRGKSSINSEGLIHRSEICLSEADILADGDEQIATSKKCEFCKFCSVAIPKKKWKEERKRDCDDMNSVQRLISK